MILFASSSSSSSVIKNEPHLNFIWLEKGSSLNFIKLNNNNNSSQEFYCLTST